MQSQLLQEDWSTHLRTLARATTEDLVICTPSIDSDGFALVRDEIDRSRRDNITVHLLTDLSPSRVYDAKTEPEANLRLMDAFPRVELSHLPSVHANAYVGDVDAAIVGSGTLTRRSLFVNYEYAIQVIDPESIVEIRDDVLSYASLGSRITRPLLAEYVSLAGLLRAGARDTRGLPAGMTKQFESLFAQAQNALILLRIQKDTPHATFAETLGYLLLKHGAMKTEALHTLIQGIHPDLCDDSIDRVIAGQAYGKKWKHQVRSAQAHLKRAALADLNGGYWRLTEKGRTRFSRDRRNT